MTLPAVAARTLLRRFINAISTCVRVDVYVWTRAQVLSSILLLLDLFNLLSCFWAHGCASTQTVASEAQISRDEQKQRLVLRGGCAGGAAETIINVGKSRRGKKSPCHFGTVIWLFGGFQASCSKGLNVWFPCRVLYFIKNLYTAAQS